MTKPRPTVERLRQVYKYDPDTGKFSRAIRTLKSPAGTDPTRLMQGYSYLCIDGHNISAQRVAWMYVYGEIPNGLQIDHIDGDKLNNRISNLRLVTKSQNQCNIGVTIKNKVGHKGVYMTKDGKYESRITVKGKRHNLGTFNSLNEAASSYREAALKIHEQYMPSIERLIR